MLRINKLKFNVLNLYKVSLLFSLLSLFVSAKSNATNVHEVCIDSPSDCLAIIDNYILKEEKGSRGWFRLKLYKLDALFELTEFKKLEEEVAPWVGVKNLPLKFEINIDIYYAKILNYKGNKEQANFYFDKAVKSLMAVSDVTYDPMLTIQVANALSAQKKYVEGMELLHKLELKYEQRNDATLKLELYENLGHLSSFLKQYEQHLEYRIKAVEWAKLQNNGQKTAVSIYNKARAFQMLEHYDKSLDAFDSALEYAQLANHQYLISMTYYRKVTILNMLNRQTESKRYLNLIDEDVLFGDIREDVLKMKKAQN